MLNRPSNSCTVRDIERYAFDLGWRPSGNNGRHQNWVKDGKKVPIPYGRKRVGLGVIVKICKTLEMA